MLAPNMVALRARSEHNIILGDYMPVRNYHACSIPSVRDWESFYDPEITLASYGGVLNVEMQLPFMVDALLSSGLAEPSADVRGWSSRVFGCLECNRDAGANEKSKLAY